MIDEIFICFRYKEEKGPEDRTSSVPESIYKCTNVIRVLKEMKLVVQIYVLFNFV